MRHVRTRDAGHGKLQHVLSSVPFRITAAALAAAVAVWALVLRPSGPDVERPLLLVSGRDDHGALQAGAVDLLDRPDGDPIGVVPDATLVEVVDTDGEWLRVRAVEGTAGRGEGWINDFFLRGQVHVVGRPPACPVPLVGEPGGGAYAELRPSEQVVLVDHHLAADGRVWVGVQPLQVEAVGLVPLDWIQELPGPVARDGEDCADVPLDPEARPHRH